MEHGAEAGRDSGGGRMPGGGAGVGGGGETEGGSTVGGAGGRAGGGSDGQVGGSSGSGGDSSGGVGGNSGGGGGGGATTVNDCTNAFTFPLIQPSDVTVVTPIGLVGGGGTEIVGRSYIFPRDEGEEVPLSAPTPMKLIGGQRYIPSGAPEGYHPDWALAFKPDCSSSTLIELYHVKEVSPSILAVLGDEISESSAWKAVPLAQQVHFDAGEAIGGYLHGPTSVAFDFIVRDDDVINEFAEPQRYASSNLLHIVCPYRYYTPELRSAFEELLGAPGAGPIPGTECGSVATDVIGTLAGQWFLNPDVSTGRGPLTRVDGYGNPHAIGMNPDQSITFGNIGSSNQGYRVYREADGWADPAKVTDEHCYQLGSNGAPEGYLYYVLSSDSEMHVFHGDTGECPTTAPTSGGKTYYR